LRTVNVGTHTVTATATRSDGHQLVTQTVFTMARPSAAADADADALPDAPFATLAPGDAWFSTRQAAESGNKMVAGMIAVSGDNLLDVPAMIAVAMPGNTLERVTVEVPHGLLRAGEEGLVLVQASQALDVLFPEGVGNLEPEPDVNDGDAKMFVTVSLLVSTDGGATFAEIGGERVAANAVRVTVQGTGAASADDISLYTHGIYALSDGGPIRVRPEGAQWGTEGMAASTFDSASALVVEQDLLSLLAIYKSNIESAPVEDTPTGGMGCNAGTLGKLRHGNPLHSGDLLALAVAGAALVVMGWKPRRAARTVLFCA
jgi:hypothetical protein